MPGSHSGRLDRFCKPAEKSHAGSNPAPGSNWYDSEARKKYHRERYHRLRAEAVIKLGGKCNECGSTEDLEFDHIDPESKEFDVSKLITYSLYITEELAKCQLLCSDCHKEKSFAERGQRLARGTHGTLSSYRYCHCVLCKEAKRKYNKEYKMRRRGLTAESILRKDSGRGSNPLGGSKVAIVQC